MPTAPTSSRSSRRWRTTPGSAARSCKAGVGFGGSCLPHQVTMTVRSADQMGVQTPLLAAVDDGQPSAPRIQFVERMPRACSAGRPRPPRRAARADVQAGHGRPAGCAGARRSPVDLLGCGATSSPTTRCRVPASARPRWCRVCDVVPRPRALDGADAAVLITEWPEFVARLGGAAATHAPARRRRRPQRPAAERLAAPASPTSSFGRGTLVRSPPRPSAVALRPRGRVPAAGPTDDADTRRRPGRRD